MTPAESTWEHATVILTVAWAERDETASQLAVPLAATFDALTKASAVFGGPWTEDASGDGALPSSIDEWRVAVENSAVHTGHDLSFSLRRPGSAIGAFVRLSSGVGEHPGNRLTIGIESPCPDGTVDLGELVPKLPRLTDSLVVIWRADWVSIVPRAAYVPQQDSDLPIIGALTWIARSVGTVPLPVAGVEVRRSRGGNLVGVPTIAKPVLDAAAILAVRDALAAASAIRPLPERQPTAPISDPQKFETALTAYVDFHGGRAVVERPERVRELFSGQDSDRLIAEIQDARERAYSVWTAGTDPNADDSRAEAAAKIDILVPGLTPVALDVMVGWWVDLNMW